MKKLKTETNLKNNIFLIGVGRSGTTLLQSMLHAHSEICFSSETHFIKRYLKAEVKRGGYTKKEAEIQFSRIKKDPIFTEFEKNLLDIIERIDDSRTSKYYMADLFNALLASNEDVKYLGDKDPLNMNYLSEIFQAFPKSKIIHIVRDPRDVIASRLKSGWGSRRSLIWHASEYEYSLNEAQTKGKSLFGDNYIEVRYEDLLVNTEFELNQLCVFLEVPYEELMLGHYLKASDIIREDELDWKSNVLKPVDQSKIGQWKSELSVGQINRIEGILQKTMLRLGYPIESKLSFFNNLVSKLQAAIVISLFKLKFG